MGALSHDYLSPIKHPLPGDVKGVAKLRTAEDVWAEGDVHPESIWISSVKQSDAGTSREVYLAAGSLSHVRRPTPPTDAAVASEQFEDDRA